MIRKTQTRAIQVKTLVYQWLVRNAERFGFRPYFYEPWHWEYVRKAQKGKHATHQIARRLKQIRTDFVFVCSWTVSWFPSI